MYRKYGNEGSTTNTTNLGRPVVRIQEEWLHLDGILGGLLGLQATQMDSLAGLSVAGHHKADVSLRGRRMGGEVEPGLLDIEETVALAKAALVLQRAAAVHQGSLHTVGTPGEVLGGWQATWNST